MPKEYVVELADMVRELQPNAMMCSRVGYGMGDYASKGDMEVPTQNIPGLWETAERTSHDVAARLAIVPMVLEARGLDVTPATLERVRAQGDQNGAKILSRILDDEIRHVAIGTKHFVAVCAKKTESPQKRWKSLVREHFRGGLKAPFNDSARNAAGLSRDFYAELAS